jgi:hypothetical protein
MQIIETQLKQHLNRISLVTKKHCFQVVNLKFNLNSYRQNCSMRIVIERNEAIFEPADCFTTFHFVTNDRLYIVMNNKRIKIEAVLSNALSGPKPLSAVQSTVIFTLYPIFWGGDSQ